MRRWRPVVLALFVLPFAVREYGHAQFEKGRESLEIRKSPRTAAEQTDRARKVWPPLWEGHYYASRLAWDRGEPKKALDRIAQAIYWNPCTAFLREDRAKFLWRTGDREGALAEIHEAIRLHPVKWQYHETLSRWLHSLGQSREAVREKRLAQRLRSVEPDYGTAIEKIQAEQEQP